MYVIIFSKNIYNRMSKKIGTMFVFISGKKNSMVWATMFIDINNTSTNLGGKFMLFLKALKWLVAAILVVSLGRVLLASKGGLTGLVNWFGDKVKSWGQIPVIGVLLKIIFKVIKAVAIAVWETLKWMSRWPIIKSIIAVIRKIGRVIAARWEKIVAWAETE